MERLPNEIMMLILHYVDLSDLIRHAKLVSKRFHSLISIMKFDELVVNFGTSSTNHWYHTYKPVNPKNIVRWASANFLQSPTFLAHFGPALKRLKISSAEAQNFDIEQLNQLTALEQLDLHIHFDRKVRLALPRLRLLSVFTYSVSLHWSHQIRLLIECDRLEIFSCNDLTDIELLHPASIRYLEVGFYHLIELDRFTNLTELQFNNAEMHLGEATGLARSPRSLKKLLLNYSRPADLLTKLAKDTALLTILERQLPADAEIYLNEVRHTAGRPLASYGFELAELDFYRQNYAALSSRINRRCSQLSYDELLDAFDRRVPADFAFRFVNIQHVTVRRLEAPREFLRFLSGCSVLRELELNCRRLDQSFYRKLPEILKVLMKLKLNKSADPDENGDLKRRDHLLNESDLDFLFQFNLLFSFSTDQQVCADFSLSLFERCRFLRNLQFKSGSAAAVSVNKTGKSQFNLQSDGSEKVERWTDIDLDQLAELIKK